MRTTKSKHNRKKPRQ